MLVILAATTSHDSYLEPRPQP